MAGQVQAAAIALGVSGFVCRSGDRHTAEPSFLFQEDMKEPLYRVLKESLKGGGQVDLFLYTRGGDTNAVWPIASLLREFDPDFEVLVPFRAHSSGTMLALAAKKIVMAPIAELSPIDPTTANQFNPRDPVNQQATLGIGVEDVTAYQDFWKTTLGLDRDEGLTAEQKYTLLQPYFGTLSSGIHPLALGNVHRVYLQIRMLAEMLLRHHYDDEQKIEDIIDRFTKSYYSHHHMINRSEAKEVLGDDHVDFTDEKLTVAVDGLLRHYENNFGLRHSFNVGQYMGFGVIETLYASLSWTADALGSYFPFEHDLQRPRVTGRPHPLQLLDRPQHPLEYRAAAQVASF